LRTVSHMQNFVCYDVLYGSVETTADHL